MQQNEAPKFGIMSGFGTYKNNSELKNQEKSAPVIKETGFVQKTYFANSMHRRDDDKDENDSEDESEDEQVDK